MIEISRYIQHPELLNRETLYDLRGYVALYPYSQAARLLMLQNLYLLHDPTFDEELRTASFYITDRTVLFNLVEARHYKLAKEETKDVPVGKDRTDTLINSFLNTIPDDDTPKRKPTVADATLDYMSYILAMDDTSDDEQEQEQEPNTTTSIIDNFLEVGGRFSFPEKTEATPDAPHNDVMLENDKDELEESYYTENLAKIYIKQGNYLKAYEIINQLYLSNPKKNVYFVDQMRFLEKLMAVTGKK